MADYGYGAEAGASNTAMNLLKAVGGYSRPSGRGWFMFRALTTASSSAAVVGLAGAVFAGVLTGAGAVGFLVASCIGFCAGSWHYFHMARAEAVTAIRRYPRLMQHHLEVNFPTLGYERLNAEQRERDGTLVKFFQGIDENDQIKTDAGSFRKVSQLVSAVCIRRIKHVARVGQLMSAHQTALESLLGIEAQREQRIVEQVVEMEKLQELPRDE